MRRIVTGVKSSRMALTFVFFLEFFFFLREKQERRGANPLLFSFELFNGKNAEFFDLCCVFEIVRFRITLIMITSLKLIRRTLRP